MRVGSAKLRDQSEGSGVLEILSQKYFLQAGKPSSRRQSAIDFERLHRSGTYIVNQPQNREVKHKIEHSTSPQNLLNSSKSRVQVKTDDRFLALRSKRRQSLMRSANFVSRCVSLHHPVRARPTENRSIQQLCAKFRDYLELREQILREDGLLGQSAAERQSVFGDRRYDSSHAESIAHFPLLRRTAVGLLATGTWLLARGIYTTGVIPNLAAYPLVRSIWCSDHWRPPESVEMTSSQCCDDVWWRPY
jgi:hypothetical protein